MKDVPGFEGLYAVTQDGHVYNYRIKKRSSPSLRGKGYWKVDLKVNGLRKSCYIHRLVAQVFIPNPNNLPQVNHKDGNKLNNNVENLEWVTNATNIKHSFDIGIRVFPDQKGKHNYNWKHGRYVKK